MDILDEAAEFLIQRETIIRKKNMGKFFNKYKNPVEESIKCIRQMKMMQKFPEAEVKTDSERSRQKKKNTSTYNTGYAPVGGR